VMSFHIIFPHSRSDSPSWLAFLAGMYLRTKRTLWRELYLFWLKIFAVSFALGVVSGIVMSFQFGTNWAALSERAAMCSARCFRTKFSRHFPGSHIPRRDAVRLAARSPKLHFLATCMVALGTLRVDVLDHLREQLDANARGLRKSKTACFTRRAGGT